MTILLAFLAPENRRGRTPRLTMSRWQSAEQTSSKIGDPEFIRVFSFPLIRPRGCYVDCMSMVIKGAKYARLVVSHVRLQSLKGLFSYKERPLHRTVMPPKPNGTSSWIKNSALIREIEHGSLIFQSVHFRNSWTFGGLFQDGKFRESLLEYRPEVPALAGHFHCRRGSGQSATHVRRRRIAFPKARGQFAVRLQQGFTTGGMGFRGQCAQQQS